MLQYTSNCGNRLDKTSLFTRDTHHSPISQHPFNISIEERNSDWLINSDLFLRSIAECDHTTSAPKKTLYLIKSRAFLNKFGMLLETKILNDKTLSLPFHLDSGFPLVLCFFWPGMPFVYYCSQYDDKPNFPGDKSVIMILWCVEHFIIETGSDCSIIMSDTTGYNTVQVCHTSCSDSECTDVGWLHQGNCPFKRNVNTFPPCVIMALYCGLPMESVGFFPFWKNITHKTWQVVHSTSNMWWQLVCWFIGDEARENMLTQRVVCAVC